MSTRDLPLVTLDQVAAAARKWAKDHRDAEEARLTITFFGRDGTYKLETYTCGRGPLAGELAGGGEDDASDGTP